MNKKENNELHEIFTKKENKIDIDKVLNNLPNIILDLQSNNSLIRYSACVTIKELLSIDENPPIDKIIESGVTPILVNILNNDSDLNNQFEASWALTNITFSPKDQTQLILSNKLPEVFLNKIKNSSSTLIKEQAFWALGNASNSLDVRNHLLKLDIINIILPETGKLVKTTVRRNAVWCMSRIYQIKPHPPFENIKPIIPVLKDLLTDSDTQVITDTCWTIYYITDGMDDCINEILKPSIVPHIIELLNHPSLTVQTPVLRIIGNIVIGTEQQTQIAINNGCLPALKRMIQTTSKNSIIRGICWTISNITAGTQQQLQHVFDNGIIDTLIHYMSSSEVSIQREAIWAISNATSSGNSEQINQIVLKGCINPFCKILTDTDDIRVIAVALEGITNILIQGEIIRQQNRFNNPYVIAIQQYNGLYNIEKLIDYPSIPIHEKARSIINQYFTEV